MKFNKTTWHVQQIRLKNQIVDKISVREIYTVSQKHIYVTQHFCAVSSAIEVGKLIYTNIVQDVDSSFALIRLLLHKIPRMLLPKLVQHPFHDSGEIAFRWFICFNMIPPIQTI